MKAEDVAMIHTIDRPEVLWRKIQDFRMSIKPIQACMVKIHNLYVPKYIYRCGEPPEPVYPEECYEMLKPYEIMIEAVRKEIFGDTNAIVESGER